MRVQNNLIKTYMSAQQNTYQPTGPFLRSYTNPVTIKVPQGLTCQHDPGVQDINVQLDFSAHHKLHADNDFDAFADPSVSRYKGPISSHLFK